MNIYISGTPFCNGTTRSYLIAYCRNGSHVFGIRAPFAFVMWYIEKRKYLPALPVAAAIAAISFWVGELIAP